MIELVGPAGVGKTTLSEQLETSGQALRGTIWLVPTGQLVRSAVRHLPAVLALYRDTGGWLWNEVKHLARLDALHSFLGASHWNGSRLIALDEGPVYTLCWLQVIGHAHFRRTPPGSWWWRTLRQWARSLDAVVVLDAPDAVLTDRIRARAKSHMMKGRSLDDVSAFATAYRAAAERVLVDLTAAGGPPVLRLDVADQADRLGEHLLVALGRSSHAR